MRYLQCVFGALKRTAALAALAAAPCLFAEDPKTPSPLPPAPDTSVKDPNVKPVKPDAAVKDPNDKSATPASPKDPADKTTKPDGKTPADDPDEKKSAGESVDPTNLSPELQDAISSGGPRTGPAVAPRVVVPPALPEISLKALVETEGKPPSALLEINGKTHRLVTEGAELSSHAPGHSPLNMIVKRISRDGVEIEVVQLKQIIYVK